ncbi:unnamed protein product, partial [Coregonus sp. 'balchen']
MKEENLKDEETNREDKGRIGKEVRALIQVMKRNCSEGDLEAVDLDSWLNDLEKLKVAFKKCTGEMAEMIESMAEIPVPVIVAPPAVKYYLYHLSPRLDPITNLNENGRKLLQEMVQEMAGVAQQDVEAKRIGKGKKKPKK